MTLGYYRNMGWIGIFPSGKSFFDRGHDILYEYDRIKHYDWTTTPCQAYARFKGHVGGDGAIPIPGVVSELCGAYQPPAGR